MTLNKIVYYLLYDIANQPIFCFFSGTPNMRRGFIHNESPLATPKSSKAGMGESANEQMDEWELKLLGKKGG